MLGSLQSLGVDIFQPKSSIEGVANKHGDCHRPDAARDGSYAANDLKNKINEKGERRAREGEIYRQNLIEINVADEATTFGSERILD